MRSIKPLTVFGHWGAPNPWKVRIILEELEIPHEWQEVEFGDVKSDEYLKITPNGRLPAIQDPNTGVTVWEVNGNPSIVISR
jgi:glutathione S-transferase